MIVVSSMCRRLLPLACAHLLEVAGCSSPARRSQSLSFRARRSFACNDSVLTNTPTGAQRRKIVDQIGELGLSHIVVVRLSATDTARRQRAKALEMLCVELESVGVQEFTLESRGPADDQRDLKTLAGLRSRRLVSPDLRMWHAPGPQEPLLWIADVCAGVVSDARIGDDLHHGLLANHITVHEIH